MPNKSLLVLGPIHALPSPPEQSREPGVNHGRAMPLGDDSSVPLPPDEFRNAMTRKTASLIF